LLIVTNDEYATSESKDGVQVGILIKFGCMNYNPSRKVYLEIII